MSSFQAEQRSALQQMGIHPDPVGTLEEVRAAGLDPGLVGVCAERPIAGVRVCPFVAECIFNLRKLNGGQWTKGEGPRNVGYYLETDEGTQKEDFCSCIHFIRHMKARMLAGQALRDDGKPGEYIRIVAQEGEPILQRIAIKKDPLSRGLDAEYVMDEREVLVPKFPRPSERSAMTYAARLAQREAERRANDPEYEITPRRLLSAQRADEDGAGAELEPIAQPGPAGEPDPGLPGAQPVRRRAGGA